jgi:hypothetical protein
VAARVERLPFTVYDIMGYLIPGMYLVTFIWLFIDGTMVTELFEIGFSDKTKTEKPKM